MSVRLAACLALSLSACLISSTSGQELKGGVPGLVQLLNDEAVQAELSLNDDQRATMAEIAKRLRDGGGKPALALARRQIYRSIAANRLLRLEQIHWQRLGGRALQERRLNTKLDLGSDQIESLSKAKAVNEAERKKMLDFLSRARFRSREAMEKYKQGFTDAAEKRLFDVLTKEQRKKLKQTLGKPFPGDSESEKSGAEN